jgi:hypothetical protein
MGINDFPPTRSMLEVRDELNGMIDGQLKIWYDVKTNMLRELNAMIKRKEMDVIILKP